MFACLDVHYDKDAATTGCVLFERWQDAQAVREFTCRHQPIAPYVSGEFYKRELPCLVEIINKISIQLDTVIIDGYVWLAADGSPGLGARLHESIHLPVIGVAKTKYATAPAIEVLRGDSTRPLYVTAGGMDPAVAADVIRTMHGKHRLPTLLKRVDQLCRGIAEPLNAK
jgi:deoxyribonuclease V